MSRRLGRSSGAASGRGRARFEPIHQRMAKPGDGEPHPGQKKSKRVKGRAPGHELPDKRPLYTCSGCGAENVMAFNKRLVSHATPQGSTCLDRRHGQLTGWAKL
jgi:hypothetical protein